MYVVDEDDIEKTHVLKSWRVKRERKGDA